MQLYNFISIPYYDELNKCYINIIAVNKNPNGPLNNYVKKIKKPKLSPFDTFDCCKSYESDCLYAIYKNNNDRLPLLEEDIDWLLSLIIEQGYVINYDMTRMIVTGKLNPNKYKLLCYFQYN